MRYLRTASTTRIVTLLAAVVALVLSAGFAQAALDSDPKPDPKPLDRAILDAVNAPAVDGVSARVTFTNGMLPSGSLPHGAASPLAAGAEGRLWLAGDGRMRLELQSEAGDAQIVAGDDRLTIYDSSSETAYVLPVERGEQKRARARAGHPRRRPPRPRRPGRGVEPVRRAADLDRRPADLHGPHRAQGRRRPARRGRAGLGRAERRPAARRRLRAGPGRARARARGPRRLLRLDLRLDVRSRSAEGHAHRRDRPRDRHRRPRPPDPRARRRRGAGAARLRAQRPEGAGRPAAH